MIKIINKLILILLTLLGFSCQDNGGNNIEYGMPTADFKATGTIVDESTLKAISNIQVVMDGDTVYSNEAGSYEVIGNDLNQIFTLKFEDIDGTDNGSYLSTDSIVDFSDEEYINSSGWYLGEKSKEINIKLNPDESL